MPATDPFPSHVAPHFNRHRGHPPRMGWLKKVHDAVSADAYAFTRADACTALAVGPSQLPAMRYWSQAMKLTRVQPPQPGVPPGGLVTTRRGRWLLDDEGADPWLEFPGSWLLLHWWLLAPPCAAPTWWAAFARWSFAHLHDPDLADSVARTAQATGGWKPVSDKAIGEDVTCLVRMYAPTGSAVNDLVDSPIRALGLLQGSEGDRGPRLNRNNARPVAPAVLAYACLEWAHRREAEGAGAGSVTLATLAGAPDGPGRLLAVDRKRLRASLEQVATTTNDLALAPSTGDDLLIYRRPPLDIGRDLLNAHYDRT